LIDTTDKFVKGVLRRNEQIPLVVMKSSVIRYATLASLVCLLGAGCSSMPWSTASNHETEPVLVPSSVLVFTRETCAAGNDSKPNETKSDGPKATIRLAQAEEALPPPQELKLGENEHLVSTPGMKIDLGGALAIVSGRNPRVAFAQAQVQEAFARLLGADVLWLPNIRAGASYNRHDGGLQQSDSSVKPVDRDTLELGPGLGAVGTGTPPVAGISTRINVGDAIFAPKVLRNELDARQAGFTATLNDTLLATALAYLDLLDAYQQRAIAAETVGNAAEMARLTAIFLKAGQGTKADAERAKTELGIRRNELERTKEAIRIASARLMELLSLNTLVAPEPQEPTIVPIALVPLEIPLPDLVAGALSNRPELAESRYLVNAAVKALRQQQFAPLIPSLLLGVSDSEFGGGMNHIPNTMNRFDFDAIIYWELRNLGFGEVAARKQMTARLRQAKLHEVQVMDQVAREVAEDLARVQTKFQQIGISEEAVKSAKQSYELNFERMKGLLGQPLELLQSIQALDQARHEYLRAVSDFDRAQFRLYRDLGWPPEG
jgi:outer membrane protein TolC